LLTDPVKPITEIALECGFSNSSSFAKSFKQHFDLSASQWRDLKSASCLQESNLGKKDSNQGQYLSNAGKDSFTENLYIEYVDNTQIWRYEMMENQNRVVEVKDMPETTLAYVRYVGPYKGDGKLFEGLFTKLFQWAGSRGLLGFPETKTIIIYHDNPDITDETKLRVSVSISVPPDTAVDGEIGKRYTGHGYPKAATSLTIDPALKCTITIRKPTRKENQLLISASA